MGNSVVKITDNMPAPMTAASFTLPEGIPRKDFVGLFQRLHAAEKHIQWALAKLWLYGERNYVREYGDGRALAEEIGIDYGTIRNYASVALKNRIVTTS
jgi:hypothetical protein